MRKVVAAVIGTVALWLSLASASLAADVTIGSNLAGEANWNICSGMISCTYVQTSGGTPVAVSPVDGQVVRWRLKSGSGVGAVKLRVLRPAGGTYTAIASSATETTGLGVNTFATSLPIKAGDVVALDNDSSGLYFTNSPAIPLPLVLYFQPALADGAAGTPNNQRTNLELLMNADVTPAASGPQPPALTPPATPVISKLRLRPSKFRAARSGASVARKRRPIGTTVSYTLSTDATVTFRAERRKKGRKRAGKCRKRGRRAKGRRCTRHVRVRGSFDVAGRTGANKFKFTGRISTRRLAKGRYRLVATPSAAGKKGAAIRASFRIR